MCADELREGISYMKVADATEVLKNSKKAETL
jgi:hypothetical protein